MLDKPTGADYVCLVCGTNRAPQTRYEKGREVQVWKRHVYGGTHSERSAFPLCSDACCDTFAAWPFDSQFTALFGDVARAYSCLAMLTTRHDVVWADQHPTMLYPLLFQLRSPLFSCPTEDKGLYKVLHGVKSCGGCPVYDWSFGDPIQPR